MKGKWWSIVALVFIASIFLSLSSCGHSQELVGITIQPISETFGASNIPVSSDAGLQLQLRALGTYIHPPVTKDITSKVTWTSNTPQMVTVNSAGLITVTGATCGATLISATVTTNSSSGGISSSGALVTGFMTANVVCFTASGGGAGSPALTVTFAGNGSGTVTSSPLALSCSSPNACLAQFASGSTVTLTATPNAGSVFGSWFNCDTPSSANPCDVTMTSNRTVTVTFN
jgi:Divergent InlB B-repeat domain/Bacterial Ig-like domain (group 2)